MDRTENKTGLNPHSKFSFKILPHSFRQWCRGCSVNLVKLSRVSRTGQDNTITFDRCVLRKLYGEIADVKVAILAPLPHRMCGRVHCGIQIAANG